MLGSDTRVRSRADLLAADAGGDVILLDPQSGLYFSFEGAGSEIWRHLSVPVSVSHLCEILGREYDAPEEQIRSEILAFLSDMMEKRLVVAA